MFYHSNLQLYKPAMASTKLKPIELKKEGKPYVFRKNLYSADVVGWIFGQLDRGELTTKEIMDKYNISRATIL